MRPGHRLPLGGELPGAGHLMMLEDPGGTQDALKAFLGDAPKAVDGRLSAIG